MEFQKGRICQKSKLRVDDTVGSSFQKTSVSQIEELLSIIKREAGDDRNFVKKAVNWALRHIGKQNLALSKMALVTAREIQKLDSRSSRWITSNAIKELTSEAVQQKFRKKSARR